MGRGAAQTFDPKRSLVLLGWLGLFFRLTRPLAAVPFAFAFVIGAAVGDNIMPHKMLFYLAALILGLAGGAHIINSLADRAFDEKSAVVKDIPLRRNPFATGEVSPIIGWLLAVALLTLAVVGFATVSLVAGGLVSFLAILAVAYSFRPHFKSRPGFDVATNALAAGAVLVLGYWTAGATTNLPWLLAGWLVVLVAATYLLTLLADYYEDRRSGITTTAVWLGPKKTITLSALLYAFSLILAAIRIGQWFEPFYFFDLILIPLLLFGAQGYIKLVRQPTIAQATRLMHRAAQAAGAGVLVIFIIYFIPFLLWRR